MATKSVQGWIKGWAQNRTRGALFFDKLQDDGLIFTLNLSLWSKSMFYFEINIIRKIQLFSKRIHCMFAYCSQVSDIGPLWPLVMCCYSLVKWEHRKWLTNVLIPITLYSISFHFEILSLCLSYEIILF